MGHPGEKQKYFRRESTTTTTSACKGLLLVLPHDVTVVDALAEVFVGRVVREPFELVLDRLGQVRVLHHRILGFFVCEVGIKVGNVEYRFL